MVATSPAPPGPPSDYNAYIAAYRESLQHLSAMMLSEDWSNLESDAPLLSTIGASLRDTVLALEKLGEDPSSVVDISGVLRVLDAALKDLYSASDLGKKRDARSVSARYDKLSNCRQQINLAIGLLNTGHVADSTLNASQNVQQTPSLKPTVANERTRKKRTISSSAALQTSSTEETRNQEVSAQSVKEILKQGLNPEDIENNAINDTAVGIKDDRLNFRIYVDALTAFIVSQDTTTPLTISINGPWGMGKSSLMKMLKEKLEPPEINRWNLLWQRLIWYLDYLTTFPALWLGRLLLRFGNPKRSQNVREGFSYNPKSPGSSSIAHLPKDQQYWARIVTKRRLIPPPFHPTIWFNAWKFSQEEQVWAALALDTLTQLKHKYWLIGRIIFWLRLNWKRFSWPTAVWNVAQKVAIPLILGFLAWNYTVYITQILGPNAKGFLHQFGSAVQLGGPLLWVGAILSGVLQIASIVKNPFQISVKDALDKPNYSDKVGFLGSFESDFSRIVSVATHGHFGWQPQKLVIFIDDLDRCRPLQAASIVEAVSLFLDSEQCVFVIGMDPMAVTTSIEAKYKELTEKIRRETPGIVSPGSMFLNKIIQISFNLPRPTSRDINVLIEEITHSKNESNDLPDQMPDTLQNSTPLSSFAETNIDVGSFGLIEVQQAVRTASNLLKQNPRLVKRFINLFRLKVYLADKYKMLHGQSLTPLAILVVWSMQWPEVIRLLLDEAYSSDITTYLADICEQIQEDGSWKGSSIAQDDQQESYSIFDQFNDGLKKRRAQHEEYPAHWCHLPWEEWIRDRDFRNCLKFMEKENLWQRLKAGETPGGQDTLDLAQLIRL